MRLDITHIHSHSTQQYSNAVLRGQGADVESWAYPELY